MKITQIIVFYCIDGDNIIKKEANRSGFASFCLTKSLFSLLGFLDEQVAASFELGDLLGGNLNGGAGLRVLGGAGLALNDAEGTKANQSDFLALVELLLDAGEASIHSLFGGHFGHAGFGGNCVNKFGFVHNC